MTVDLGDGSWFNLRTSNTEPLLRLNVEARTAEDVDEVVGRVAAEIAAQHRDIHMIAPATIDLDDAEGLLAADRRRAAARRRRWRVRRCAPPPLRSTRARSSRLRATRRAP